MKHADFERMLRQSLQVHPGEQANAHLAQTVQLAKARAGCSRRKNRILFRQFLWKQVRYIGWQLWSLQGLLLLLFDRMLTELWDSPTSVARLLFCISTLVAMMSLPLLYRSRKHRMQEIEASAYFSCVRLLMAKLAVIGIGDLLLLAGTFLTTMLRTSIYTGSLTFYLLLPFLVMSAAYLFLMGHCSGKGFFVGSVSLGCGMLLLAVSIPGRWLPTFQQGIRLGFFLPFAVLLIFSAEQLRYLLRRSPYTELQII